MKEWTKKNHGLMVNLYQIKKMLGDDSEIGTIEYMMIESYTGEEPYISNREKMSFAEYVNEKRHRLACILGNVEYA